MRGITIENLYNIKNYRHGGAFVVAPDNASENKYEQAHSRARHVIVQCN
jgi:hypothetical protein